MKYIQLIIPAFICLFLLSCNPKDDDNSITLDDIVSGDSTISDDLISEDSAALREVETINLDEELDSLFRQLRLKYENIISVDTLLNVDRYENLESSKYEIKLSGHQPFFGFWKYKNNALAKNAFMNWIQCYGKNCSSISLNDTKNVSNEQMSMILIENKLYYLVGFSQKQYQTILEFLMRDDVMPTYAFYQNGRKGIEWFSADEFQKPL